MDTPERKNWLFSATSRGAAASAALFSVIETAKANGHEPYWYLRFLFDGLVRARTAAELSALLPQNIDPKGLLPAAR
jgi:transposase